MDEPAARITFVRHGQSVANQVERWQGQGDSPLSELGIAQAKYVGARLASRRFSRVVSSDLTRAVDTARATGFAFEQRRMFREFDVGRWEGLTHAEVAERFPEEIARLQAGEDVPLGGGESYSAFSARIAAALAALKAELAPGDHALVVCHGGVIAAALALALGLARGHGVLSRLANTSLTELSFAAGGARLHRFNDTLHLANASTWPPHRELEGVVGLVSERRTDACPHSFSAFYETPLAFPELAQNRSDEARDSDLAAAVHAVRARHPADRVGLTACRRAIRGWVEGLLHHAGAERAGAAEPNPGTVSHVGYVGDKLMLLDYATEHER